MADVGVGKYLNLNNSPNFFPSLLKFPLNKIKQLNLNLYSRKTFQRFLDSFHKIEHVKLYARKTLQFGTVTHLSFGRALLFAESLCVFIVQTKRSKWMENVQKQLQVWRHW